MPFPPFAKLTVAEVAAVALTTLKLAFWVWLIGNANSEETDRVAFRDEPPNDHKKELLNNGTETDTDSTFLLVPVAGATDVCLALGVATLRSVISVLASNSDRVAFAAVASAAKVEVVKDNGMPFTVSVSGTQERLKHPPFNVTRSALA
jgi:hypothetical protein